MANFTAEAPQPRSEGCHVGGEVVKAPSRGARLSGRRRSARACPTHGASPRARGNDGGQWSGATGACLSRDGGTGPTPAAPVPGKGIARCLGAAVAAGRAADRLYGI